MTRPISEFINTYNPEIFLTENCNTGISDVSDSQQDVLTQNEEKKHVLVEPENNKRNLHFGQRCPNVSTQKISKVDVRTSSIKVEVSFSSPSIPSVSSVTESSMSLSGEKTPFVSSFKYYPELKQSHGNHSSDVIPGKVEAIEFDEIVPAEKSKISSFVASDHESTNVKINRNLRNSREETGIERLGRSRSELKMQEFFEEAAKEVQIIKDFVSGSRSREAARKLLHDRRILRENDSGDFDVRLRPRFEYDIHYVGISEVEHKMGTTFDDLNNFCNFKIATDSPAESFSRSSSSSRSFSEKKLCHRDRARVKTKLHKDRRDGNEPERQRSRFKSKKDKKNKIITFINDIKSYIKSSEEKENKILADSTPENRVPDSQRLSSNSLKKKKNKISQFVEANGIVNRDGNEVELSSGYLPLPMKKSSFGSASAMQMEAKTNGKIVRRSNGNLFHCKHRRKIENLSPENQIDEKSECELAAAAAAAAAAYRRRYDQNDATSEKRQEGTTWNSHSNELESTSRPHVNTFGDAKEENDSLETGATDQPWPKTAKTYYEDSNTLKVLSPDEKAKTVDHFSPSIEFVRSGTFHSGSSNESKDKNQIPLKSVTDESLKHSTSIWYQRVPRVSFRNETPTKDRFSSVVCSQFTQLPNSNKDSENPEKKLPERTLEEIRSKVVKELVDSERDFVKGLRDVVENYIEPCKKRSDIFSQNQIKSIFTNFEDILNFQDKFLTDLEAQTNDENLYKSCIGETFIKHKSGFQMYSEYCNSHSAAIATLQKLYGNNEYKKFFEDCGSAKNCGKLPLDSFLLTPVQRICKYPLQLAKLLKYTKSDHPDHATVIQAFETMKQMVISINEKKRKLDDLEKLIVWQCGVEEWRGEDLISTSSQLIHEGEARIKVDAGNWIGGVALFLFDHQMIYCKKDFLKRNAYVYKGRISLDKATIINVRDGKCQKLSTSIKHGIQIVDSTENKSLTCCFRSEEEKSKWLHVLSEERKLVAQNALKGLEISSGSRELVKISASLKGITQTKMPRRKLVK